ncbi:MAG: DNA-formamidopyrimidine glycosylase family protein [Chloroflexota bacterium]|nr:formamidopyrimidine-DNA glycosylase [Dehalococcoidia bacterium]MDW8253386.1 DNA-formamidopyrimidine glycosylase family protein [Chloroflexota bacterium]
MPELPEVETIRRGLAERIVGLPIAALDLLLPKLFLAGDAATLVGRRIVGVRRVAKFLVWDFDDGRSLVLHLNLSGQIVYEHPDGGRFAGGHPIPAFDSPLPHKTTRLVIHFQDGSRLYLSDVRTFAKARLLPGPEAAAFLAAQRRGPDALLDTIEAGEFAATLRRRKRAPIKAVLLDQAVLSGIGNIYADEALHAAGIHPLRAASSLSDAEAAALLREAQAVVALAVTEGVAKVRNGRAAPDAALPRVHARRGEPCPRCRTPIERIVVAQRGTYFCPRCQPATRSAPPGSEGTAARPSSAEALQGLEQETAAPSG